MELAVKAYGEYVSIRPHDAGAYFHYGRACYDLSVYFVGVGTCPRHKPSTPCPLLTSSLVVQTRSRLNELRQLAIKYSRKARQLDPKHAAAWKQYTEVGLSLASFGQEETDCILSIYFVRDP